MRLHNYLGVLFLGTWTGALFLLRAEALEEMSPVLLLATQSVVAISILLPLVILFRVPFLTPLRRNCWILPAIALTNLIVPFLLVTWGQTRTESGTAGVLSATTPVFTALLAGILVPGDPLRVSIIFGLLVGLAGVGLIAGVDLGDVGLAALAGDVAIVGASISFGFGALLLRWYGARADFHQVGLAATMAVFMVAIFVPLAAISHEPGDLAVSVHAWLLTVALSIMAAPLGVFALYVWLIRKAGPLRASLLWYISPAAAVLLGWAVRNEELAADVLGGLFLIFISLTWVNQLIPLGRRSRPVSVPRER